jgi:hypothetical protein
VRQVFASARENKCASDGLVYIVIRCIADIRRCCLSLTSDIDDCGAPHHPISLFRVTPLIAPWPPSNRTIAAQSGRDVFSGPKKITLGRKTVNGIDLVVEFRNDLLESGEHQRLCFQVWHSDRSTNVSPK